MFKPGMIAMISLAWGLTGCAPYRETAPTPAAEKLQVAPSPEPSQDMPAVDEAPQAMTENVAEAPIEERPDEALGDELAGAEPDATELFWNEIYTLHGEGEREPLIARLTEALRNDDLANIRPNVLSMLMLQYAGAEQFEQAERVWRDTAAIDPTAALVAVERYGWHLLHSGQEDRAVAWLEGALKEEFLDPAFRVDLYRLLLVILVRLDRIDDMADTANEFLADAQPEDIVAVMQPLFMHLRDKRNFEGTKRLVAMLDPRHTADNPPLLEAVLSAQIQALADQQTFAEATAVIARRYPEMTDDFAAQQIDIVVSLMRRADNNEMAEVFVANMLNRANLGERTQSVLTRANIHLALDSKDTARIVATVIAAKQRIADPSEQLRNLHIVYAYVMTHGKREEKTQLLEMADALRTAVVTEQDRTHATNMVLDGCFFTGNMERALKVAEAGVPGMKPGWNEMLMIKIKAHIAHEKNDLEEAIRLYVKFVEIILAGDDWWEDQYDPTLNMQVTRNQVAGLNYARAGDLSRQIGQNERALEYYALAKAFYAKALETTEPDTDGYKHLEDSIRKIEQRKTTLLNSKPAT